MQTRRDFIIRSSIASAGSLLIPNLLSAESVSYTGIQLWTVRDFMEKDPKGTLAKLAKMGYNEVESFGWEYFGMGPKDFKTYINSIGLKMRSAHGALGKEKASDPDPANLQESIDRSAEAGLKYYIMPWMQPGCRDTADNLKKMADYMNRYGAMCQKSGLKFAYHNHDFEFAVVEGKTVYEHLLDNTDPKLVTFEMDLYWVTVGGKDPLDYFKKYPGRFPLWHVKDLDKTKNESTEIGNGKIDFTRIFKQAKLAGLELPIVEQEAFKGSSLDSAKICLDNLKKMNY
ncbi:MAG: sugar phosphate isomerase/epimerase [Bacteroidota bacterium]|nr:sugar phosphate isomerase/epimerase [Bacteroidota bacterium]